MDPIRSSSNPLVKLARAAGAGRAEGLVLLEGDRLVEEAIRRDWTFEAVLVADDRAEQAERLARDVDSVRLVDRALLERVSRLVTSPGVIAIAREPAPRTLESLGLDRRSLVVVAAGIQDPGNLGALARTAEAAGADALVTLPDGCRPWNEKALRGSMGSLLRLPVVPVESAARASSLLTRFDFRKVIATTRGGTPLRFFDWSGRVSLWITSETGGLPDSSGIERSFESVSIPMASGVESLNLSAAAAILLFAAGRVTGEDP